MSLKNFLTVVLLITIATSCKKKTVDTDNLFKFRDYISYTTSGITSVTAPIQINLANDVDSWETGNAITDDILTIKPHVQGKLTIGNKHTLLFL